MHLVGGILALMAITATIDSEATEKRREEVREKIERLKRRSENT